MNKKDLQELKSCFSAHYDFSSLNRVMTAFIDADRHIRYSDISDAIILPDDKVDILRESLKKVMSGTLDKNFVRYDFPRREYEEGGIQNMLYSASSCGLDCEEECRELLDRIVNDLEYCGAYAVIIGCFDYTPIANEPQTISFLIGAICPVCSMDSLLEYNETTDEITNTVSPLFCISKDPTDGFLFPVYSQRSADVNGFMYYAKNPKAPNISLIEDVMGCSFTMTPQAEKDAFISIVSTAAGGEMDYIMAVELNDRLIEFAKKAERENLPPIIGVTELTDIFKEIGVSYKAITALPGIFADRAGSAQGFHVGNLTSTKTTVKAGDICITADRQETDLIRTDVVNGRHCIVIELDDPAISVNDLNIMIPRR